MILSNTEKIKTWRRYLHQYPEISFRENNTSNYITGQIEKYPDVKILGKVKHGLVAVLDSGKPGKTVALRADFDALPLQEESDVPFKSQTDGIFHACGHDCHAAMLLGAMDALCEYKNEGKLSGKVVFIFQHAEELLPGGAIDIVQSGLLDGLGIEAFFALHVFSNIPTGTVKFNPVTPNGFVSANTDAFKIIIQGKGTHGAIPDTGIDSLLIGTEIVQAINFIVSRYVPSAERAVVSIGKFTAGTAPNIIPHTAEIEGTVRTMNPKVRDTIEHRLSEMATNICTAYGASCKTEYKRGYNAMVNDENLCKLLNKITQTSFPQLKTPEAEAMMGGEDFSAYRTIAPTLFLFLGAMPDSGEYFENHHPKVTFNEKALPIGTALLTAFALEGTK
jgi:amidohydrolase